LSNYPDDTEWYALNTFDSVGKSYGRWMFKSNGAALEYGGGWDEKSQTMKWHWAAKDGSQSTSLWHFRDVDRHEIQVLTKDAVGKTTLDVQATSIRRVEPGWVQLFNGKDLTGWVAPQPGQGDWQVDKLGHLIGKGDPRSYLFTQRDDYSDFHLR